MGRNRLEPGDVVCFPVVADGAHHVRNETSDAARIAMLSTKNEIGIAESPDSDKLGIWVGATHYMLLRSRRLDYRDRETS
jgi:uncharacterized cupin superfamily protein